MPNAMRVQRNKKTGEYRVDFGDGDWIPAKVQRNKRTGEMRVFANGQYYPYSGSGNSERQASASGGQASSGAFPASAPSAERSLPSEIGRGFGLGTRSMLEGTLGFGDMVASPVRGALNWANERLGGDPNYFMPASKAVPDALNLPTPKTGLENVLHNVQSALASLPFTYGGGMALQAGRVPGMVPTAAQAIGKTLTASPGVQFASTAAGGAAQGEAQNRGVGPGGQALAAFAGGLSPAGAVGASRLARQGLGSLVSQDKLAAFRKLGMVPPSLGAVSDSGAINRMESALEQNMFSSGVMRRASERGRQSLTETVDDIADSFAGDGRAPKSYEEMGMMARAKAEAEKEAFTQRAADFENTVYRPAEQLPARMDNTLKHIDDNAARFSPATALEYKKGMHNDLGEALRDAQPRYVIQGQALTADELAMHPELAHMAQELPPALNIASLRRKAQDVGNRLKAPPTADTRGMQQYDLGQMYGALKNDIRDALPEPIKSQVEKYNKWYAQQKSIRQSVDDVFFGKRKDNEGTAKAILAAEASQLDKLRHVVGPEGFNQLRGGLLGMLARDKDGSVSAARLATELGKGSRSISQGTKDLLFGDKADALYDVAAALAESNLYRNTSNTAGASAINNLLQRMPSALATGGAGYFYGMPGAAATAGLPYGLARLTTSPSAINRLAGWGATEFAPTGGAVAPVGINALPGLLSDEWWE